MNKTVMCPGCGLILPSTEEQFDERYHASSACRELYDQLSAYTLSLPDASFPHQFAVDTYAAQHAGTNLKPITLTFALVGLYLACEHNYTGRQVQRAHMLLAKTPKQWPPFRLPDAKATLSVRDVLNAPEQQRIDMLQQWEQSVWRTWEAEQAKVANLVQERLNISIK